MSEASGYEQGQNPERLRTTARAFGTAVFASALILSLSAPAAAQTGRRPLGEALEELARETRIEILFREKMVAGKTVSKYSGPGNPQQQLTKLLAGTGLTFKRGATGVFLIEEALRDRQAAPKPDYSPPIADILVVGARTLNADLARNLDDIQPYQVLDFSAIERTQPSRLDEFLQNDLIANRFSQPLSRTPLSAGGAVRSLVDLHGLGTAQTLMLIDGRRLPAVPVVGDFRQPDVGAMPTDAIERIEVLGLTAGGIFGIGAAGGAVNIISKNEFDGGAVHSRFGVSARGDAAQRRLSVRFGLTSPESHTRLSVRLAVSHDNGLSVGDRGFTEEAGLLRIARDKFRSVPPTSSSINVASANGANLVLLPSLGGEALNGSTTYLPLSASSLTTGGLAALKANAGRLDVSLAPDSQGRLQSLVTPSTTLSAMLTVRQNLGARAVAFVDYLRFQADGHALVPAFINPSTLLLPGQSGNPFNAPIIVTFPVTGVTGEARDRTLMDRLTAGAIIDLGRGWSASVDAAIGRAIVHERSTTASLDLSGINLFDGNPNLGSELAAAATTLNRDERNVNRLHDLNLKVAGSPLRLPAGRVYLTVTGELREERSPGEVDVVRSSQGPAVRTAMGGQREREASAFLELRAPILSRESAIFLLRGLELQFAARHDRYSLRVPVEAKDLMAAGLYGSTVSAHGNVTAVNTGVRIKPSDGMTVRTSLSSGYTAPTAAQITPNGFSAAFLGLVDPRRIGETPSLTPSVLYLDGGSPTLRPQPSRAISVGTVLEPRVLTGSRLSFDYSVLRQTRVITDYAIADFQHFIDHEASFPGRIVRGELSAADAARGFTGGPITRIDASYLPVGRATLRVIDVRLDYTLKTNLGDFHAFASGSWEPSLRRRGNADEPSFNAVGGILGPLAFRGSTGMDWTQGGWSAGLNARMFGAYRITYAYQLETLFSPAFEGTNQIALTEQGGKHIPSQAYIDGYVGWGPRQRSEVPHAAGLSLRLGVKNLFDKKPPLVVPQSAGLGYSLYGNPVGRSFALELASAF